MLIWHLFVSSQSYDSVSAYRGIKGGFQVWLNGHLGLFFKLDMMGVVNLLLIPILVYESSCKKSILKTSCYLIWAFWMSFLLVGFLAYFNYRYWITFSLPVAAVLFGHLWYYIYPIGEKVLIKTIVLLLLVQILNVFMILGFKGATSNLKIAENRLHSIEVKHKKSTYYSRLTFKPQQIFNYFNNHKVEGAVLLNSLPMFYIHCKQKAYMYFAERDIVYSSIGKAHLVRANKVNDNLPSIQAHELNIRFVLSSNSYNIMFPEFKKWVDRNCIPILKDGDVILYRMNISSLNPKPE